MPDEPDYAKIAGVPPDDSFRSKLPWDPEDCLEKSIALFRSGKPQLALDNLNKGAYDNPMHKLWAGMCNCVLKRYDQAVSVLSEVIEEGPPDEDSLDLMVTCYSLRARARIHSGDLQGAMSDSNEAIELDPEYIPSRFHRGRLRFLKRDFDGAWDDLTLVAESSYSSQLGFEACIYLTLITCEERGLGDEDQTQEIKDIAKKFSQH